MCVIFRKELSKLNTRYIICGPFTNEESEKYLDVLPAAGKFLYNLAWGLKENGNEVIKAVYIPYNIPAGLQERVKNAYKQEEVVVLREKNRKKTIQEYQNRVLSFVEKDSVVVFYNMNYSLFGLYSKVLKKGGRPLLIVADHGHSSSYKSLPRKVYAMICEREFKKFDKVIILSSVTKIKFKKDASIEILEGGINFDEFSNYPVPVFTGKMRYTSTGSLKPLLGVDMLLNAISESSRDDFTFTFSGRGESVPAIQAASENDQRIYCKGFLSRKEYTEMMQATNVFVSARNMEYEKNNNSFPSKILEYLASGRLIISTRFPGYQKFEDAIFFYDGSNTELLALMDKIAEKYDEVAHVYYDKNRNLARLFDWRCQAKKIIEFME